MLWCRKTFEQHFSEDECRLFPTQRQLFDYIDSEQRTVSTDGEKCWKAFSIELLSEEETAEQLSRTPSTTLQRSSQPLFRRVPSSASATAATDLEEHHSQPAAKRQRRSVRADFSLLYGESLLSGQSRFFVALTRRGVESLVAVVDPLQLHLYEIIREKTPCHLYLDVEREGNTVSVQEEHNVSDSSASSVVFEDDESVGQGLGRTTEARRSSTTVLTASIATRHGQRNYRATEAEYNQLLPAVREWPLHVCPLNCRVVPDNSTTTKVLLEQLTSFVHKFFPFLVSGSASCNAHDHSLDLGCGTEQWAKDVMVMNSVPLPGTTQSTAPVKFSQHYIVKLHRHLFDTNASTGEFVRLFIDYLETQCAAGNEEIHRALFFHGQHTLENVLDTSASLGGSPAIPFVARKCVIDTAVYSRNRMMRCLGSCKLHKANVLQIDHCFTAGTPSRPALHPRRPIDIRDLEASLISVLDGTVSGESLLALESSHSPKAANSATLDVFHAHVQARERGADVSVRDVDANASTIAKLEQAYQRISGCSECYISATARRVAGHFEVYQVLGTRFCQNIMREHRSNNVYLVVDTEKGTWVQKCFDPDCSNYRSTPQPL